ncbi:NAD(P)H-dependent oxidoreductase [Paenibacillus sp. P32E]|uniref:NAD(P)H-dependent oxidoreductase n=1 Tax=Paenibacillus sp. P32E TaxID=1349434 RepID=UPI00093E8AB9|nr:NAD(P)H-dependent oxidoreductase [Paenibacillus sp. P32E]OKP92776.1 NAD(P)H dehydrogenase [Paenibacillus sp. P32E]
MRIAIIFDHPYGAGASANIPHARSYSAALLASVMRGLALNHHEVDLMDLHADGFNPVISAAELAAWRQGKTLDPLAADYQKRIIAADHLIFIFPIWWECMPATTKGFLDKVFVKGTIYHEPKPGRPFSHLLPKLTGVSLLTVMSTPDTIYRWFFGNPVTKVLFRGTFRKMGIHKLRWYNYTGMERRSPQAREHYLQKTEQRFARL